MENPFIFESQVYDDDFVGRESVIKLIFDTTLKRKARGNLWITGGRQTGKTSLLLYVQGNSKKMLHEYYKNSTEEDYSPQFVYCNCQSIRNETDFYERLHVSIKNTDDLKDLLKNDQSTTLSESLKKLIKEKCFVVFLLDEFDSFLQNLIDNNPYDFAPFLGGLNERTQGTSPEFLSTTKPFTCVITSNNTINELIKENEINIKGSGLVTQACDMPFFTKGELGILAEKYLNGFGVQLYEEDINLCFNITKGYPYLAQKVFSAMYERKKQGYVKDFYEYEKQIKQLGNEIVKKTFIDWGIETGKPPRKTKEVFIAYFAEFIKTNFGQIILALNS